MLVRFVFFFMNPAVFTDDERYFFVSIIDFTILPSFLQMWPSKLELLPGLHLHEHYDGFQCGAEDDYPSRATEIIPWYLVELVLLYLSMFLNFVL